MSLPFLIRVSYRNSFIYCLFSLRYETAFPQFSKIEIFENCGNTMKFKNSNQNAVAVFNPSFLQKLVYTLPFLTSLRNGVSTVFKNRNF